MKYLILRLPASAGLVAIAIGCTAAPQPVTGTTIAGCDPPPASVFTAAGVDVKFAETTLGKVVVGDVNVKTDPKVISLASQAMTDEQIRLHVRCIAMRRDNFTPEQVAYFEAFNAFVQTKPNPDQFTAWQAKNPFPGAKPPNRDSDRNAQQDQRRDGDTSLASRTEANTERRTPVAPVPPTSLSPGECRFPGGGRNVVYSSTAPQTGPLTMTLSSISIAGPNEVDAVVTFDHDGQGAGGTAIAFRPQTGSSGGQAVPSATLSDGSQRKFELVSTSETPFATSADDWLFVGACESASVVFRFKMSPAYSSPPIGYTFSLNAQLWLATRSPDGTARVRPFTFTQKRN